MIRLNQARTKRRKPRQSDDNSISDLLGPSNPTTTVTTSEGVTPEADRLFNELLGENASGIASTQEREDDESSAMSSIFSGLLDKYKKDAGVNSTKAGGAKSTTGSVIRDLDRIPETPLMMDDSKVMDVENNAADGDQKSLQKQDQLSNLLNKGKSDEQRCADNEEDTLITKPREISFDPTSDDVSGLFGGGGVSTAHLRDGVESYMGTYAKQRQNRRPKVGGGLFGNFGATGSYSGRRKEALTRASSRQSGVDSILEDLGMRSVTSKSLLTDDFEDGEDNKGHNSRRHFRSTARKKKTDTDFFSKFRKGNQTTLVLVVLIVYVIMQIPTVQKHDKMSMKKIKSERHKYDRFDNGGNYDDGTGAGHELRRAGMMRRENEQSPIEDDETESAQRDFDSVKLRGGLKQPGIIHADSEEVLDSVDDMAIFSKHDTSMSKWSQQGQAKPAQIHNIPPDEHDDQKAALMKPPDDPPSITDRHVAPVDKLNDIDPIKQDPTDALPSKYKVFASVKTPYVLGRDTPFFWHIPRSGGVIVKTLMSHCLKMTLAAEVGELEGHDQDEELKVVTLYDHNYTNVNVATADGIARAQSLGLVPSHLADVIVSAQVDKIPSLYTSNEHARAFVMFRNPVDRAVSMFYFLKSMGNERLKNMTLDDYAKSDMIENNWLVRILSESMTGPIDSSNLETAQQLIKEKFVVGLLDNKRGSFARFDHYFKWKENPNYEAEFGCIKQIMDEKYVPKHPLRKGDDTWNLIFEQNRFDMLLYEYAKTLFKEQSSYIFGL